MHDRDVRRSARAARAARAARPRTIALDPRAARAAVVREALTIATLAMAALAALGATGCGGGARSAEDEAPARQAGASGGEVAVPGATASRPESAGLPGTAGSGIGAVGSPSGSIGTPGTGAMHSGDPSDAGVRSLLDAINAAEIEASQLAAQKAQSAEVKRYAQSMLAAHRQAPPARAAEAQGGNSASDLLTPLEESHRKTMQQLQSTATGPAFDRAYINAQVAAHEGALQTLERAETAAQDPTLVDRVRRTESEVERHLAEARRVQALVSRNTPQ